MMNYNPYPRNVNPYPYYPGPSAGYIPGPMPPVTSAATVPFAPSAPAVPFAPAAPTPTGALPMEQSYIENILRLNLGKVATIYMTFENNPQWNAKVFKGVLEAAGRDHIIISDPQTGLRTILLMVNLDYITIEGELNYAYPIR